MKLRFYQAKNFLSNNEYDYLLKEFFGLTDEDLKKPLNRFKAKQFKNLCNILFLFKRNWQYDVLIKFFDSTKKPILDTENKSNSKLSVEVLIYAENKKLHTIGYYDYTTEEWCLYGEDFFEYRKKYGNNFVWTYFPVPTTTKKTSNNRNKKTTQF